VTSLSTILSAVDGLRDLRGDRSLQIGLIRYDSRHVQPGDLFVAVNGRDDHALEYVPAAINAGAVAIVTDAPERMPEELHHRDDITLIVVDDARRAMAQMAQAQFGFPARGLKLYGVTGTNGKTTTTYVLRQILEAAGRKVGVIGTLGVMLGDLVPTGYTTPEAPELAAILNDMVHAGMDSVSMEVSSHALALDRVAGLDFDGAIFTNLTQDHLDFHSSMQEYHDAKKLLFDRLDPHRGAAVVNVDDIYAESLVRDCHAPLFRYGTAETADARIERLRLDTRSSRWQLILSPALGGGSLELEAPLLGAFNVANITAGVTLALVLGISRERLVESVRTLRPVPGRMESIDLESGATAVVDYAHTPDALEHVLDALRHITGSSGSIIAVFGCGGDRDRAKRPMMGAAASRLADRLILTSDNPRSEDPESIIDEIMEGIDDRSRVERISDRAMAIERALESAGNGDIVLIAGKGHEDYQIVGGERRHFNDCEVVREWNARTRDQRLNGVTAA
jgi:UDP-N-acetylmuramoyl-L-alanyl-D-glutamate--2,6-diaminopimelate ligase